MEWLKTRISYFAAAALLLAATVSGFGADSDVRFVTHSDNRVTLEGTDSIHDWTAEGQVIEGTLKPGAGFPTSPGQPVAPGKVDAVVEVAIPVCSLHSRSPRMDEVVYTKLKATTNPRIRYKLTELRLKTAPASQDAPYVFQAEGSLAVAGVTNRISMPVEVQPLAGKRLKISGHTSVKMSDYGIGGPWFQVQGLDQITVGDEVRLGFEWLVEEQANPH